MLTSTPVSTTVYLDTKFAEAERLVSLDATARAVYRRLAVLRTRLAAEVGVKPYHVYTNRQLIELSERRPKDLSGLSSVSGFGQKRLIDYGDLILASIRTEAVRPASAEGGRPMAASASVSDSASASAADFGPFQQAVNNQNLS